MRPAQQFCGAQAGGAAARRGLGVAAAQQLPAVAAGGDRRGDSDGRVGAAYVLEGGQHPVGDQHRGPDPADDVDLLPWRGRHPHVVVDAQYAGDLGGDHHVRVIGEPVCPRPHRNPGLDQRGGDQAAVLAAGKAELDGLAALAQQRDRVDERGGHASGSSAGGTAGRGGSGLGGGTAGGAAEHLDDRGP